MTEKQLYSFCKKEYNRLRKQQEDIWKKHDEIYDKEGMDKASDYLGKDHVSERLRFFDSCLNAFDGLKRNKSLIDNGGEWIKNYRKKFLDKFEKTTKKYNPDEGDYNKFRDSISDFAPGKERRVFDESGAYESMFDDENFIKYIDDMGPYSKRNDIINKFQVAIGVCYKSANRKFLKNKLLQKDCEALERSVKKIQNMSARAKLSTDDLNEFYENASDMIDEYLHAKKICDSLNNKLKSKIDKESKEWGIEESVNYFPY